MTALWMKVQRQKMFKISKLVNSKIAGAGQCYKL